MQIPTLDQLKRALHLQENIESLQKEMKLLFTSASAKAGEVAEYGMKMIGGKKKRKMSASHRAAIVRAQNLRWSKVKGKKVVAKVKRKSGKMSAAGRAAIVKAQKLRWKKFKKAKAVKPRGKRRGRKAAPVVPLVMELA